MNSRRIKGTPEYLDKNNIGNKRFLINDDFIISVFPKNANSTIKGMSFTLKGVDPSKLKRLHREAVKNLFFETFNTIKNIEKPKYLLVRSPYDRIYSGGNEKIKKTYDLGKNKSLKNYIPKYMNFSKFLNYIHYEPTKKMNRHFFPQMYWLNNDIRNIKYFDKILKMEDNKTGKFIEEIFGMELIHFNNPKKETITKGTKKNIDIVNHVFGLDFEAFNYEKG